MSEESKSKKCSELIELLKLPSRVDRSFENIISEIFSNYSNQKYFPYLVEKSQEILIGHLNNSNHKYDNLNSLNSYLVILNIIKKSINPKKINRIKNIIFEKIQETYANEDKKIEGYLNDGKNELASTELVELQKIFSSKEYKIYKEEIAQLIAKTRKKILISDKRNEEFKRLISNTSIKSWADLNRVYSQSIELKNTKMPYNKEDKKNTAIHQQSENIKEFFIKKIKECNNINDLSMFYIDFLSSLLSSDEEKWINENILLEKFNSYRKSIEHNILNINHSSDLHKYIIFLEIKLPKKICEKNKKFNEKIILLEEILKNIEKGELLSKKDADKLFIRPKNMNDLIDKHRNGKKYFDYLYSTEFKKTGYQEQCDKINNFLAEWEEYKELSYYKDVCELKGNLEVNYIKNKINNYIKENDIVNIIKECENIKVNIDICKYYKNIVDFNKELNLINSHDFINNMKIMKNIFILKQDYSNIIKISKLNNMFDRIFNQKIKKCVKIIDDNQQHQKNKEYISIIENSPFRNLLEKELLSLQKNVCKDRFDRYTLKHDWNEVDSAISIAEQLNILDKQLKCELHNFTKNLRNKLDLIKSAIDTPKKLLNLIYENEYKYSNNSEQLFTLCKHIKEVDSEKPLASLLVYIWYEIHPLANKEMEVDKKIIYLEETLLESEKSEEFSLMLNWLKIKKQIEINPIPDSLLYNLSVFFDKSNKYEKLYEISSDFLEDKYLNYLNDSEKRPLRIWIYDQEKEKASPSHKILRKNPLKLFKQKTEEEISKVDTYLSKIKNYDKESNKRIKKLQVSLVKIEEGWREINHFLPNKNKEYKKYIKDIKVKNDNIIGIESTNNHIKELLNTDLRENKNLLVRTDSLLSSNIPSHYHLKKEWQLLLYNLNELKINYPERQFKKLVEKDLSDLDNQFIFLTMQEHVNTIIHTFEERNLSTITMYDIVSHELWDNLIHNGTMFFKKPEKICMKNLSDKLGMLQKREKRIISIISRLEHDMKEYKPISSNKALNVYDSQYQSFFKTLSKFKPLCERHCEILRRFLKKQPQKTLIDNLNNTEVFPNFAASWLKSNEK